MEGKKFKLYERTGGSSSNGTWGAFQRPKIGFVISNTYACDMMPVEAAELVDS